MTTNIVRSSADLGLPDSIFTWRFQATGGDSWGGKLVADSTLFSVGNTVPGAFGTYAVLLEEERGVDLSAFALAEGQVFVEWYWDLHTAQFLVTRNGAGALGGSAGFGSEQDAAWTGIAWSAFGLAGRQQADAAAGLADARFTWIFEADTGDRWSGVLFDIGTAFGVGSSVATPYGAYRITAEEALGSGEDIASGTVRLTDTYFDNASGAAFPIQGANGTINHGTAGLGSEVGTSWTGAAWMPFGQGGSLQADAPLAARPLYRGFGVEAGGWSSQDRYPRALADLNGDGHADVVGFGNAGVLVALGDGSGDFRPMQLAIGEFGFVAGGWMSQDLYPRTLADVNADGRADLVGFGNAGVLVALAEPSGGFGPTRLAIGEFGLVAGGWMSQDRYPRMLADVNGDGRADLVGFGNAGVLVALGNAAGAFDATRLVLNEFGVEAGGWGSQDRHPRALADVNGDGYADLVGFGNAGVLVALGDTLGGFGPTRLALSEFGFVAGGWARQDSYPRMLGDVNGDGHADLVGFGNGGVIVAVGTPQGGFARPQIALAEYGYIAGGWTSQTLFPRTLGDINGDGRADVVGFGNAGIWADTTLALG